MAPNCKKKIIFVVAMPAETVFSPNQTSLMSSKEIVELASRSTPTIKRRLKKKSSPKKVRLSRKVFLKHKWTLCYEEESQTRSELGTFETIQVFFFCYFFFLFFVKKKKTHLFF